MNEKLKAKLEIRMSKINNILKILENEDGTKFSAKAFKKNKNLVLDIEAKDLAGLQACLNSYIEKIKLIKKLMETEL